MGTRKDRNGDRLTQAAGPRIAAQGRQIQPGRAPPVPAARRNPSVGKRSTSQLEAGKRFARHLSPGFVSTPMSKCL